MYNIGIEKFLKAKSVCIKPAIKLFLENEKQLDLFGNINITNDYIQSNWNKFSTFIDKSIKNGLVNGKDIKLNTFHSRKKEVLNEFKNITLTKQEMSILNLDRYDWGIIQSFLNKKGLNSPPKDESYTSKKLQNMSYVHLLREHNLVNELAEIIKLKKIKENEFI